MRKSLASRIAGLAVLYFAMFCVLVLVQFSNSGSFSLTAGAMIIKGRYAQNLPPEKRQTTGEYLNLNEALFDLQEASSVQKITDGIKIYYGGLEFVLSEEREKGFFTTGIDGTAYVNPEYLILTDNIARFVFPGGTTLVFNSIDSQRGSEMRINAEFAENVSGITIPVIPRRSSLILENEQLGIMYGGSRYFFNRYGRELEDRKIILTKENTFISYRSIVRQKTFDPADYIIARSQNYDNELVNWKNSSFTQWQQNASVLHNEDDIIAYCTELFAHSNYQAVTAISRDFQNNPNHSYRSSVFTGGMSNAYRTFTASESEKINRISRLIREKSTDIFKEEHLLNYLFTQSNTALASEFIDLINDTKPGSLIVDHCPGLLEVFSDIKQWRPSLNNPAEHLTEQILSLVSENLVRDAGKDQVFALNFEGMNLDFSFRMGSALIPWAKEAHNNEWEAIGKSLVLSALESGGGGNGKFYNALRLGEYYPRAALLTDNSQWAWTVSPSVRASYTDSNLNITFSFPVNTAHYVIICGIRPFTRLQIYGSDWRSEAQFERSDSSGWVYYQQEEILVLKLRHRSTVENVRIIYRVEAPPPPPPPPPPVEENYYGDTNYNVWW
jgi:hypothetical protein